MSGAPRQSYYEIALTNRQVLSVFIVLLVAVLAAFVSGVWVGQRGLGSDAEIVEAQEIRAAVEDGEEPLERLDFFSRDDDDAGDDSPAEADRTEAEPSQAVAPEPDPIPVPAEPRTPAKRPAAEPPVKAPEPEPEPEPAVPAPRPTPARVAQSPTPSASGTLVVQVFSSNNQVQAQSVVDRLRTGGYPAGLAPVDVSGKTMYRVRIGPYSDRKVAEGIAEQVRRDYRLETWITE